jgi:hypothetical protein
MSPLPKQMWSWPRRFQAAQDHDNAGVATGVDVTGPVAFGERVGGPGSNRIEGATEPQRVIGVPRLTTGLTDPLRFVHICRATDTAVPRRWPLVTGIDFAEQASCCTWKKVS